MPERPIFISDFDGTLTDNLAVADEYLQHYTAAMADDLGLPLAEVASRLQVARQAALDQPGNYGWVESGKAVTAAGDPMIVVRVIAEIVLDELGILDDKYSRIRRYYQKAIGETPHKFRPDAEQFIHTLGRLGRLVIISNSDTERVEEIMAVEMPGHQIEIMGRARKQQLEDLPEDVHIADTLEPAGFPHPVQLRRGLYYQALCRAAQPQPLQDIGAVIGDLFELDLSLPHALGLPIALLANDYTPAWEIPYVQEHGFVGYNLAEVSEWLAQRYP